MQIGMIEGVTRILGRSQGYLGLPVRDEVVRCAATGADVPSMVSVWHPTPAEAKAIAEGAPIYLVIHGFSHPPVCLLAGKVPALTE